MSYVHMQLADIIHKERLEAAANDMKYQTPGGIHIVDRIEAGLDRVSKWLIEQSVRSTAVETRRNRLANQTTD